MNIKFAIFITTVSVFCSLGACVSSTNTGGELNTPQPASSTQATGESAVTNSNDQTVLNEINIIQPEFDSTVDSLTPEFIWTGIGDGASYEFKLYNLKNPDRPIELLYEKNLTVTELRPKITLKPATDYGWTVRFIKDGEPSAWVMHETKVFGGFFYSRSKRFQRFRTPD